MPRFSRWLRRHSEHHLLAAAQAELARRYLDRPGPVGEGGWAELFWQRVFVPVYRALPWRIRQNLILALPGSHRREWEGRAPPARPAQGGR